MKFYETLMMVRLPMGALDDLHKQVDSTLKERLNYRLPYSLYFCAHPDAADATIVKVRTVAALGMPGEKTQSLDLSIGDQLEFDLLINNAIRFSDGSREKQRERSATDEEMLTHVIPKRLNDAGFEIETIEQMGMTRYPVSKRKRNEKRHFIVSGQNVRVRVKVKDVSAAEQAIGYGIGRKKIYGFGMLRNINIL